MKKTALVTGANKGIGLEIVRQLADKGFHVFLSARNRDAGENAVESLKSSGLDVSYIQLDVCDPDSIKSAFNLVKEKTDRLDVLVNNAGIMIDKGHILKMDIDTLQQTLNTNAYSVIRLIQQFMPLFENGSRIINMSSELGSLHNMGSYSPAYSISKTMMNAVTRQFAAVLSAQGIAVNTMSPGWVRTDMGGQGAPRSVEKGAETAVWLATETPVSLTGKYFKDKQEMSW